MFTDKGTADRTASIVPEATPEKSPWEPTENREEARSVVRPAGRCWSSVGMFIQMRRVQGREEKGVGEKVLLMHQGHHSAWVSYAVK